MARESYTIEAMVHGYHVYKEVWCAAVGEELFCVREVNYRDPFAVAVIRSGVVVGHVPRKISSVCWMFLRRGGTISCTITDGRRYSEDLPQGGLEVPCTLTLRGAHRDIGKAELLLKRAFSSDDHADKENEPLKKRSKLSLPESEVNKISSGEKLSDLSMNFAQKLLKSQFPGVNGLQSTLLQYKPKASVPPKDQLQVIHSRGDHWIIASTVGCTSGEVLVCDSLYGTLDTATLDVIANLFHSSIVKMLECQKQKGGTDCGLFAIAYATAIAHGVDPTNMTLNQAAMRSHLIKCFEEENLSLFPST